MKVMLWIEAIACGVFLVLLAWALLRGPSKAQRRAWDAEADEFDRKLAQIKFVPAFTEDELAEWERDEREGQP